MAEMKEEKIRRRKKDKSLASPGIVGLPYYQG
jgi:hypothetical protein